MLRHIPGIGTLRVVPVDFGNRCKVTTEMPDDLQPLAVKCYGQPVTCEGDFEWSEHDNRMTNIRFEVTAVNPGVLNERQLNRCCNNWVKFICDALTKLIEEGIVP